jgi:hypothetical protein
MSDPIERPESAAWQQFLIAKRAMLDEYRRAREHSKQLPVQTHHGVVGEAVFRDWLKTFLPRRFGVTAGHIRGQRLRQRELAHFDVIIYDQIESPVLWTEANNDKSASGQARIIPAEYVRAVLEVKATFNRRSVREASDKLVQLNTLAAGTDAADDPYPTYLPANVVIAIVFFELRRDASSDIKALDALKKVLTDLKREPCGAVILAGEGRPQDDTGLAHFFRADKPMTAFDLPDGLLSHICMSGTEILDGQHIGVSLSWSDVNFSRFAFDLLASITGRFRSGYMSSFHGLDLSKLPGGSTGG